MSDANKDKELAEAKKKIAALEAMLSAAMPPGQAEVRAKEAAIRKELKAKAKKGPNGGLLFRVGAAKHYRLGVQYQPGEVIEVMPGEEPSITFTPVSAQEQVTLPAEPTAPVGRPSDMTVA